MLPRQNALVLLALTAGKMIKGMTYMRTKAFIVTFFVCPETVKILRKGVFNLNDLGYTVGRDNCIYEYQTFHLLTDLFHCQSLGHMTY